MVNIVVDGIEVSVDESKNLIDALKEINIEVPHFCYHPKLEVVGMCRICLIETGMPKIDPATKSPVLDEQGKPVVMWNPKLQAGCNTAIVPGMYINVANEKVKKAREGVMEFLLINHPLDCPVCDKSGECSLQNYSFAVGHETTRYKEVKRDIPQEKIGTNLLINHNRCILCYRCVRFDRDIVGIHDLEMQARGNDTIIAYTPPKGAGSGLLDHNYQGALADICPVGALLNENTLFRSRVWWYEQNQSICHGCSTLCNVTTNVKNNEIYRYMPPENPEKNGYFICDKGRFSTGDFSRDRLFTYLLKGHAAKSKDILPQIAERLQLAKNIVVIGGTTESQEDLDGIQSALSLWEKLGKSVRWEYRTLDYMWKNEWDVQIDFLLTKDQRPNSAGVRARVTGFASRAEYENAVKTADLIFVLNEFAAPYAYRAENFDKLQQHPLYQLVAQNHLWERVIVLNTHANHATAQALAAFPIKAFPEKAATFIDKKGTERKSQVSIKAPLGLLTSAEVLSKLNQYVEQTAAVAV